MAYNLRTGLLGSGDVDINVSLSDLNAANITSGQFGDARLSDMNAAKLTGTLSADRIADATIPKSKIGENLVPWAETEIPVLSKAKIDPTHSTTWDVQDIPSLPTSKITSGSAFPVSFIPALDASKIATGSLSADRIPELSKSKISSTGEWLTTDLPTIPKFKVSTAETWALADIPNLPATKITSGTFDTARIPNLSALKITTDTLNVARIPNLDASKITTGTLSSDRIPNLDASKITTGTIDSARLPSTHDILDYNAVSGDFLATSVGNSWTTIHDDLRSNNVAQVPPSAMIEVEFSFFYSSLTSNAHTLLAQLVDGGTSYEYVSQVINNNNLTYSTANTHVAQGSAYVSQGHATVKWVLKFASSAVGDDIDMEPQLKVSSSGLTVAINSGLNTTSGVNFPSRIFKITALPAGSTSTVYVTSSGG